MDLVWLVCKMTCASNEDEHNLNIQTDQTPPKGVILDICIGLIELFELLN